MDGPVHVVGQDREMVHALDGHCFTPSAGFLHHRICPAKNSPNSAVASGGSGLLYAKAASPPVASTLSAITGLDAAPQATPECTPTAANSLAKRRPSTAARHAPDDIPARNTRRGCAR